MMIELGRVSVLPRKLFYVGRFGLMPVKIMATCNVCKDFIATGSPCCEIEARWVDSPDKIKSKGYFHVVCVRATTDGRKFMPRILEKVRALKRRRKEPDLVRAIILELAQ